MMITITMKKSCKFFEDIEKIVWAKERFGDDNISFKEPMQLTFENDNDRLIYALFWDE